MSSYKKLKKGLPCIQCQKEISQAQRPHGWLCGFCDWSLSWNNRIPFIEVMNKLKEKVREHV